MLNFLRGPILGVLSFFFIALNTLFWILLVFILAFFRIIVPHKGWRRFFHKIIYRIPENWTSVNNNFIKLNSNIEWDVRGLEDLKYKDWYLMISNHVSWTDIFVIYKIFHRQIPSIRFFMKKELQWQLPLMTQACMIMDYPVMHRYSREYLKAHPERMGKDIEVTRKACEKYKNIHTTMMIFPEAGRCTEAKRLQQQSPYKHLLKPKAGGMAFVLMTMGDYLHTILDVTIVYPDKKHTFWDFLCGRLTKVIVHVNKIPITNEISVDYENDPKARSQFQKWLNQRWQEKDVLIEELLKK